jgi:hypothetical protein
MSDMKEDEKTGEYCLQPALRKRLREFMARLARIVEDDLSPYSYMKQETGTGSFYSQIPISLLQKWGLCFPFAPIYGKVRILTNAGWYEPKAKEAYHVFLEFHVEKGNLRLASVSNYELQCLMDGRVFRNKTTLKRFVDEFGPNLFFSEDGACLSPDPNVTGGLRMDD